MCKKLIVLTLSLCLISSVGAATVNWDFENGNEHHFTLWSVNPPTPIPDDHLTAGDETLTGVGGPAGLPDAGVAWTVGPPTQFDGLKPVVDVAHARVDANGLLDYSLGTERIATESGTLNTYNLNQHGDYVHTQGNDQVATSPTVLLGENAVLSIWSWGGGSGTHAPEYDSDPFMMYTNGSSGIVVFSAEDYSILATIHTQGKGTRTEDTLDLSAFAGQKVMIDVVDAFEGGWGWLAIDEIQITNATILRVNWDFENGNDHGFAMWCVNPATPGPDDPNIAGDESLTGVGGPDGLPDAGNTWTIGPPDQFDGLLPAFAEGCHIEGTPGGVLQYGPCNDPFDYYHPAERTDVYAVGDPPFVVNPRGQMSYLNTYNLSQWGDDLHSASNDQIATSPPVLLYDGAELTVWSHGGGNATHAPTLDPDPNEGYTTQSSGIAVLSAEDRSLLASVYTSEHGTYGDETLDLSAFAGQTVIIEVVDSFEGGWGWIAVDEIQITNAIVLRVNWDFENGNDHVFTLRSINPATPAPDDPATAGDEALTGGWDENDPNNLPQAGMVWEIGTPAMNDGLLPGADPDHARTDANGLLDYASGRDRFLNHDHGFLNTFSLNYHGDYVHDQENDQIATSPTVLLREGAMLTAITVAGGADTEPILDEPGKGYTDGSGGIAVLSAADGTILASMMAQSGNEEEPFTLDLSAFAGQQVYIEVVDAHEGGWGWIAVDSIVITNAL